MQAIAEWLKTGTYEQGVALYEQHGSNTFLKTKFAAGANDYNVAKLREELSRIASPPALSKGEGADTAQPVIAPPMTFGPGPETAKKYLQLCKTRDNHYRRLNMLMEQKFHLPEGEDLRLCCVSILTTHQKVTECWALIDYYVEHGNFPPEAPIAVKPVIDPKKEMQLLRQTISKAKARLELATCRDRAQTETLLAVSRNKLARLVALKKDPNA